MIEVLRAIFVCLECICSCKDCRVDNNNNNNNNNNDYIEYNDGE